MKSTQHKKTQAIIKLLKEARDYAPDETARQSEIRVELKKAIRKRDAYWKKYNQNNSALESKIAELLVALAEDTPKILIEHEGFRASIFNTKQTLTLVIGRLLK